MSTSGPRHVLVTGGSRGIGRAIVEQLVARGVTVTFTYRKANGLADSLVADCDGLPGRVIALEHDLESGGAERLIHGCLEHADRLDGLILNAATWTGGGLVALDDATWWRVLETNLRGSVRVTRAALPQIRRSGLGSITFIASAVGLVGWPGDTAYASSKSALTGFARSLAKEVARDGTRVNIVAPGFVETDMTAEVEDRGRARILERTLLGRFGTAEEIATAAVFLSEDAQFATGVVLPVDGGWVL